jgi:hypothetical protein
LIRFGQKTSPYASSKACFSRPFPPNWQIPESSVVKEESVAVLPVEVVGQLGMVEPAVRPQQPRQQRQQQ